MRAVAGSPSSGSLEVLYGLDLAHAYHGRHLSALLVKRRFPKRVTVAAVTTILDTLAAAGAAPVAASLVTGVVADDNAILWTAAAAGLQGDNIAVRILDGDGDTDEISVTVSASTITVTPVRADGEITSTAAEVIAAVTGNPPAAALVGVDDDSTSDGSGVVVAAPLASLAGGAAGTAYVDKASSKYALTDAGLAHTRANRPRRWIALA